MEHDQVAADGTIYDNGYGIMLVPRGYYTTAAWNSSGTVQGGYIASTMHTSTLPTVVNNLKRVLSNHIVNRNVLLSNSDNEHCSNSYIWTKSDATLMSVGQMTGTFGTYSNKYDDGEANYKLPIFNFKEYKIGSIFWLRGVSCGNTNLTWYIDEYGNIKSNKYVSASFGVRPLIYIR